MRSEAWSAVGVEGGIAVDDEELEGSAEGQHRLDARKLSLDQGSRFVCRYAGNVGHVLGHHRRKSEFAADNERRCRSAHVVVVDVYGTDGANNYPDTEIVFRVPDLPSVSPRYIPLSLGPIMESCGRFAYEGPKR